MRTRVYYKTNGELVGYWVETSDPVFARTYLNDMLPNVRRTTCLAVVNN